MTTPVTLRIPLQDIAIDGDNQCAWVKFPDGELLLQGVMAAIANPEKAAVIPTPPAQEEPPEQEQLRWHRAHTGCINCHRIQDVRNTGLGGPDEVLCDGRCDEEDDDDGQH